MPSESDNKMEELLKAYARKRREEAGGPFVLHPATRRLLQAEVGQGRPKATGVPPSLLEMLMRSWPRLAFATSVVVAVGLIIWITSPKRDSQMNLAQAGKRPLEEVAQASGEARKDSPTTPEAGLKKPVPALGLSGPAESKAVEEPKGGAAKPNEWGLALNKAPESDSGSLDNYKKEVGARRAGIAGGGFGGGTPGIETVEPSGPRSATTPLNFGANMLGEAQDRIASRPKAKLAADFGFPTPTNFSSPTASTAVGAARGYAFYALGQAPTNTPSARLPAYPATQSALSDNLALDENSLARESKLSLNLAVVPAGARDGLAGSERLNESETKVKLRSEKTSEAPANSLGAVSPTKESLGPAREAAQATPAPVAHEIERLAKKSEALSQPQGVADDGVAAPKMASAASTRQLGRADDAKDMVRDRVHFSQVREPSRPDPAPSQGPPTLLSSFEVEQDGDRIRIYDADGSVYDGQVAASIEPASQFAGITSASEQAKRGLSLADKSQIGQKAGQLGATASQQKTVFRASGTNRALNQLVVINGTLISATNAGAKANTDSPAQSGPDPTLSYNAPAPPAAIPPLLRIQGRAKFGATNEMEINAVRGPGR